jgi:benzoyl-CoA reductase/2-hydroxyglutaryl-CoA dehydratase subunit BcrC/BadD/HgdB
MTRLIQQLKSSIKESAFDRKGSIGIFCPYSVEELIDAAAFHPVRLIPRRVELQWVDAYLPSNFCSYLRHIADRGLRGELEDLSGIVFSHSCDGARRTFDIFEHYIGDIPAQFVDVPKASDDLSVSYFRKQLVLFKDFLEKLRGEMISDEALAGSIVRYNRDRELLRRLYRIIASQPLILGADELMQIIDLNATIRKDEANKVLERLCAKCEKSGESLPSGTLGSSRRVFISGNMFDSLPLLGFIEECGGLVVGDDFCFGGRYGQIEIAEEGDPLTALAEGYLSRVPCGRMENNADRFDFLLEEVKRTGAQGLIYTSLKFCDHFLVDYPALKELLDRKGMPSLFLEGEYFSFAAGQVKTRVEAFLELL